MARKRPVFAGRVADNARSSFVTRNVTRLITERMV